MTEQEVLDMMNSDYKLWSKASDKELGNGVVAKTITLPWGIGEYTINMEGMDDANKRRAAVNAYGEHIRGIVNERIDDTAITSRAQVAAARSEQDDSGHGDSVGRIVGVLDEKLQATHDEGAEEAR